MKDYRLHIGIPEDDQAKVPTIAMMRVAINRAQHESSLVRACFNRAWHEGLSGEETYVMLAYSALCSLEGSYQRELDRLMLDPMPPVVVPGQL